MWQRVQKRQQCMCLVFLALLASARCSAPHGRPESVLRMHRGGSHRVIVKYDIDGSAGGLINQLLCHVAAFMLAVSLKYEILLPHALSRSSFNVTWEEQRWHKEPLDTLLNVDSIVRHWRHRGIIVHKDLDTQELPSTPTSQPYSFKGENRDLVAVVEEVFEELTSQPHLSGEGQQITVLELGVINSEHFPFNVSKYHHLVNDIVRSLEFAPAVSMLADKIIHDLFVKSHWPFNGVHLRLERDGISAWASGAGQSEELWESYLTGMEQAGFSRNRDLYIAAGLEYGSKEFKELSSKLKEKGLCKRTLHKDMYLSSRALAGLHSEQRALIDLLVLVEAERYVGFLRSSFSCYTRDLRTLKHKSEDALLLIWSGEFPSYVLQFQRLTSNTED